MKLVRGAGGDDQSSGDEVMPFVYRSGTVHTYIVRYRTVDGLPVQQSTRRQARGALEDLEDAACRRLTY